MVAEPAEDEAHDRGASESNATPGVAASANLSGGVSAGLGSSLPKVFLSIWRRREVPHRIIVDHKPKCLQNSTSLFLI